MNNKVKDCIFLLLLMISFFFNSEIGKAQNYTLNGTITENEGQETLIGASILVNQKGTISDFNGKYDLILSRGSHTVVVSYIGYESQSIEIILDKDTELNISLKESTNLLETATVTSGKFEKPLGEITVSMELLKPKIIESTNTTKISDVLERVPGVTIIDGQPNIRGGSGYSFGAGSRVLLLVDDIPALQADAGFPNWDDIPVELTNQIEILKGASSALYGSAAMNGIINLRTDFAKSTPETKLATGYTLYGQPQNEEAVWWGESKSDTIPHSVFAYVTHKQKFGKLDFVGSLFWKDEKSWNRDTYINYVRGAIGLKYRISDRLAIGLNANVKDGKNKDFFYWANGTDLALTGTSGTFSESDNTRFFIDPFLTYFDKGNNKHKLIGRIYSIDNAISDNRSNKSALYYTEYQFQKKFNSIGLTITTGMVYSYNTTTAELFSNTTITGNNAAIYLQGDKKFGDRLNLSIGARYERNEIVAPDSILVNEVLEAAGTDVESKPVVRIGVNYKAADYTYLRASWGQGYRFPTIAEKYISTQVGFAIFPNVELFSETGWTAEVGVKQGFKIGGFNGLIDLAAFRSKYFDMMEFTFNVNLLGFQSLNIGNTEINGIDFNVSGQGELFSIPLTLLAGYTYIDPKFQDFGVDEQFTSSSEENILKYRYKHTAKFDIGTDYEKFNFAVSGFYYSYMENIDNLFQVIIPGLADYRAENNTGFMIFEARASYQVIDKLKVSVLAKNLLNKTYTLRPALVEAPFNFGVRLDYEF